MPPPEARAAEAADFLARAGWGAAERRKLAGDASFRRYERLTGLGGSAVLMDAPPEAGEDCRPFVAVGGYFRSLGFSAPALCAADLERGFLLLEDLGDDLFARILAAGGDETLLYATAVDLLLELHTHAPPESLPLAQGESYVVPPYSKALLMQEADLLPDWYLPELTGRRTSADARAEYDGLWQDLMPWMRAASPILVHRDYHAENLIWLPERPGSARVGLLDYQDGVLGHPAYDLISLLSDARRDVSPALSDEMLARYVAGARTRDPGFDAEAFHTSFAVLGAQRNCKILGIFARLWRRDGKPGYLALLPRVWRNLERDLAHPALAPVKNWLNRAVPPALRAEPLHPADASPLPA